MLPRPVAVAALLLISVPTSVNGFVANSLWRSLGLGGGCPTNISAFRAPFVVNSFDPALLHGKW